MPTRARAGSLSCSARKSRSRKPKRRSGASPLLRRCSAAVAEAREGALARVARTALVMQSDATVRTEIQRRTVQVQMPLASRAHPFRQARQRQIVSELTATFLIRQTFTQPLLLQITGQRQNGLTSGEHRDQNAHAVTHIAAVAG